MRVKTFLSFPVVTTRAHFGLTSTEMEHRPGKKQFVLGFIAPANISAVHSDKAEHHAKEPEGQPAHEKSTHSLDECWETQEV